MKDLGRLKNLDLSLTSITEKGCRDLATIHKLQTLDLSATGLGDEGIQNLLTRGKFTRLQLEELRLRFNSDMTEQSLSLLATHMTCLKILDIRHCEVNKNDAKATFLQLQRNGTVVEGGG